MSFDAFALEVIFQALLLLNILQIGAILLKRLAKKVKDQSSNLAAAMYYSSIVFFYASYAFCLFFAAVVLWIGFQYPELRHPLRSPLDFLLVKEEVSSESLRGLLSSLISVVLLMALVPGFRKLLHDRQRERQQNSELREKFKNASGYAARRSEDGKSWRNEKQGYDEAIALVLASDEVPEALREKVFQLTKTPPVTKKRRSKRRSKRKSKADSEQIEHSNQRHFEDFAVEK